MTTRSVLTKTCPILAAVVGLFLLYSAPASGQRFDSMRLFTGADLGVTLEGRPGSIDDPQVHGGLLIGSRDNPFLSFVHVARADLSWGRDSQVP